MTGVLLGFLILAVLGRLLWAVAHPDRLYQFPTLCSFVYAGFVVPEAMPLYYRSATLPPGSLDRVLLFSLLSFVAIVTGFNSTTYQKTPTVIHKYDERLLFRFAMFAVTIGLGAMWKIHTSGVDTRQQVWSGSAVVYNYFGKFFFYGMAIFILIALRSKNRTAALWAGGCVFVAAARVLIFFRRAELIELLATIAFALYFVRHVRIPRVVVIASAVLLPLIIAGAHEYRYSVQTMHGIDISASTKIDYWRQFKDKVLGGRKSELENAAMYMSAIARNGSYSLGAHYWNDMVHASIPKVVFGATFKDALYIPLVPPRALAERYYGYIPRPGVTDTGFMDAFWAFGYAGVALFGVVGVVARTTFIRAIRGDLAFQFYFLILTADALHTITHSTSFFLFQAVHACVCTMPFFFLAMIRAERMKVPVRFPAIGRV